jgi:hypothetical protein
MNKIEELDTVAAFEAWLFRRLPNLSDNLFDDPTCLTDDARRERVKAVILTRDLEFAVAGMGADRKCETFGQVYLRIYGVPL